MSRDYYAGPHFSNADPFNENNDDTTSEFEKLLALENRAVTAQKLKPGIQITGQVLQVGAQFLFIDLGGKSAAALAIEEFTTAGLTPPQVGEAVAAFVRSDNGSEIILTRSIRRSDASDATIQQAFEGGLPIEGKVEKVVKGGFEITVAGKRGFVPQSHMDAHSPTDPEKYVGLVLPFIISEYRNNGRQFVLSRRALLKAEQNQKAQEVLQHLEVGQTVHCTISRFVTFGAFVDLGGPEALLPLSEMSWTRINNPEAHFQQGQSLSVKIIRIEKEPKLKIAVSFKEAHPELRGSLKKGADAGADIEQEAAWGRYQQDKNKAPSAAPSKGNAAAGGILADAFLRAEKRKVKK